MSAELLANRYELGERLGTGGMSTVVLAVDRRLEREVAVKILAEHLADDRQFVSRFRREALSAARLVHPNIVQVYDFGIDDLTARQYIVMEYVQGQSGAEILRARGMLPVHEALGIVAQACRGLDYAHQGGVIHRDVKPGNLLRSDDGVVKLADFGIAKAVSEESSITQVGAVLGTAAYLAPEQATGRTATARSDIYSLGVVTYQLLSGRLPYEAQSLTELVLRQQREAPPLLDQLNPEVTPELAAAVDRTLSVEPEHRFATAEELRVALTDGARGITRADGPEHSTQVVPAATAATRIVPRSAAPAATAPPATRSHQRQPIQPAKPRHQAAVAPPPPAPAAKPGRTQRAAKEPRRRRKRRLGSMLFILLLIAAAVAGYAAVSQSSDTVHLRKVVYDTVGKSADQLQQLIRDNTQ